jgi:hypothetical protein
MFAEAIRREPGEPARCAESAGHSKFEISECTHRGFPV